ncbi:MAG TPA: PilZ domain-containing protein [Fimbriimonas sp.]
MHLCSARMGEQRRHLRTALQVEFRARAGRGAGHLLFEGTDLSPGGTFLRSELLLEPGETVTVEFQVPGAVRPLSAEARIAWVRRFPKPDEDAGMGVQFLSMSEEDRALLSSFLGSPSVT